jgi:hypothetical protein
MAPISYIRKFSQLSRRIHFIIECGTLSSKIPTIQHVSLVQASQLEYRSSRHCSLPHLRRRRSPSTASAAAVPPVFVNDSASALALTTSASHKPAHSRPGERPARVIVGWRYAHRAVRVHSFRTGAKTVGPPYTMASGTKALIIVLRAEFPAAGTWLLAPTTMA